MRLFKLVLSLFLVVSLSACSTKSDNKITIVLDWVPNTNHTGLYVALEKGYFNDLNVEVVQPPEGSTTALIGSGGAQFGISFQDTLAPAFAKDEPLPVTAVAALLQHNTSGIISLKETGIHSPKDMEGHTYATWDSPIELAILNKVISDDGGDFNKVNLLPNTITDVVSGLQSDLETVWVYYAWDGIATKYYDLDTNFFLFRDYASELDFYSPVLIANNDYLKDHPDEAKSVIEGIQKGYEYAIEHPEEAATILHKQTPELDKGLLVESQKWISNEYKSDVEEWGYIDPLRWNNFYQWLNNNHLVEQDIPENAGFSNEYLSKP